MRNSSINLLYILVATLMAGALQSCDDDYFNGGEGTKVTITATTAFSNTTSRAVFEGDKTSFGADDIEITNYCFLLFDDDGNIIDRFDIDGNALPYVVELSKPVVGKNYHAFLLGNVTAETLSAVTTIDDLQNSTFEINRMYNLPEEEEKSKFTWSSYLPFSLSAKNLNFILNPNVAKITAKITNSSSESVIKSVRVKNVVNKVGYAQNALNEYSPDYITNVSSPTFIKYDIETFDTPIATGESKTISWYVPQNIQGDGTRIPGGDKANETYLHGGIPDNATYVEIDGVRPSDNVTASYRVYPGIKKDGETGYADMTNFDVKADVIYNLDITISDDGIDADVTNGYKPNTGSTATAKIKLPENSNCYMIHPIADRIAGQNMVYELPVDRVNDFWKTIANNSANTLTENSTWVVEVIWQDIADKQVIKFCDEYGANEGDTYSGVGLNPFCFKLLNRETDPNKQYYGNILVGLKKQSSDTEYLWSWHLWITDYNPDKATPYTPGSTQIYQQGGEIDKQGQLFSTGTASSYPISNPTYNNYYVGNVQHYHSIYDWYWGYNRTDINGDDHTRSAKVWDGNGIYANKWIMDRNLGAISPNVSAIPNPLDGWGMYYQFGRKDPFSFKVVYDITGKTRKFNGSTPSIDNPQWNISKTQATYAEAVNNPKTYYAPSTIWLKDATSLNVNWFSPTGDPMKPNHSRFGKTLFDPCPPGWCVPSIDVFYFGNYSLVNKGTDTNLSYDGPDEYTKADNVTDGTYKSTDFGYAKICPGIDAYGINGAHTSVTVHVDVNGKPNTSMSVNEVDHLGPTTQADAHAISYKFNSTITGYADRYRMFSTLYSTIYEGSTVKLLKTEFPMQGRIAGETGTVGAMSLSGNVLGYDQKARWPAYYCCSSNQACLWGAQRGSGGTNKDGATLAYFGASMLVNRVHNRHEVRNGRLFMRFHGSMGFSEWLTSRGQNVRCIQIPDNSTTN